MKYSVGLEIVMRLMVVSREKRNKQNEKIEQGSKHASPILVEKPGVNIRRRRMENRGIDLTESDRGNGQCGGSVDRGDKRTYTAAFRRPWDWFSEVLW